MTAPSSGSADVSGIVEQTSRFVGNLQAAFAARLQRLSAMPDDAAALAASLRDAGTPWTSVAAIAALSAATVVAGSWGLGRVLGGRWGGRPLVQAAATLIVGLLAALGVGLAADAGIERDVARLWVLSTTAALLVGMLVRAIVVQDEGDADQRLVGTGLASVAAFALVGVTLQATLRRLGASAGLHDSLSLAVAVTITASLVLGYVLARGAVQRALLQGREASFAERRLAVAWPLLAAGLILVTFVVLEISTTLAGPVPGLLVLASVLFLLLSPHLDQCIVRRTETTDVTMSVFRAAARRTARSAFWALVLSCLGMLWISPLSVGIGYPRGLIVVRGLDVAALLLAAVYLWHLIGAVGERAAGERAVGEGDAHAFDGTPRPATRLATLAPLITMTVQILVVALAGLSILIALGVNAWPFVAGLSVFGLAIGFGSQSLVKDIVSGVFFLLDDAFRMGEYIETSQAKGAVERISIRSVALRHPRGALATVPYGSIGKVVNFSRDWVIDKIAFRVAFDTDPAVVRKLFKKIGQDIAADPELGPDLIQPFKSQGVFAVDDGTLVIRAKFMARPGRQFMIRKAILAAVHNGFRENGIVPVAKFPIASNG